MNFLGNIISGQDIVNKDYVDEKVGNAGGNITVDTELSETSENPIANKTVAKALSEVADAFEGKQNTIADLDEIRAGAAKGATAIQSVKTINGESILGEGDIVVSVDTSNLATKEELQSLTNEIIANEEVHAGAYNDLNTRLNELSENVQGETVTKEEFNAAIEGVNNGISAKQDVLVSGTNIKTINNESILGSGNIEINVDTSNLATKEELQNLQNEVIANEEVVAAAFNDVNERINAISENVSGTTVTKEELESTVKTINQTISDNKSATDTAIEGLEASIGNVDAKFANYATTEALTTEITNLTNEIIANEEVHAAALNDLNTRLAALGATAIQSVKTINGQSIVGEGDITIEGSGVSEEYVDNAIASAITNTLNTAV